MTMLFDTSRFVYPFVTSTTYGNWLPGDKRGFVSPVIENGQSVLHNVPHTPYAQDISALKRFAENKMKSPPVFFNRQHAEVIVKKWYEVCGELHWFLFALAVMPAHVHVVLAAQNGQGKCDFLRELKAKASRALNQQFGKQTWWTESGSCRFSNEKQVLHNRIEYTLRQVHPLIVWRNPQEFHGFNNNEREV
jgi:REP element-mobilizing transposase RayT